MRQFFLRAIVLGLAISLSGCLARPMATVSTADASARSASLSVRLAPADGMRLLATPPSKTAADVDRLEIHLQIQHEGEFVPLDAATGQPSRTTANPLMQRVDGPLSALGTLTFGGLKARSTYRVLARGYEAGTLITDDARSFALVGVGTQETVSAVTVPLTIVTPFGAETQVSLSLWGATLRIAHVKAVLSSPTQGIVAQLDVPFADLAKPLDLAALRAQTTYTLELQAFEAGNATAIATASTLIPVTDDEAVATRSVPLSIKGDMKLPIESYSNLATDGAGNLHVMVSRNGQEATDVFRFTPTGGSSKVYLPFRVDFLTAATDGTRYINNFDQGNRPLRIVSEEGATQEVSTHSLSGMAVDAAGSLFISSTFGSAAVRRITPAGVETLVTTAINRPGALAVGRDGSLYVGTPSYYTGSDTGVIWRIAPKPNPADGYEAPIPFCTDFGLVIFSSLAVDSRGNVYALVRPSNDASFPLHRISPDGLRTEIPETFRTPWAMTVDQQDNVYVAELNGRRVRVL